MTKISLLVKITPISLIHLKSMRTIQFEEKENHILQWCSHHCHITQVQCWLLN